MGWVHRLPEVGELLGQYRIVEVLGSGSYGHVYKAEHAGKFYAVKVLRGRLLHERVRREIRILLHLDHPDVVRFYGCGYWPEPSTGHWYIVMEFAGGRTLEAYASEENPSARRSARIVMDVALTLGEVLRQGAMHRDLKPDNIIIRDVNVRPLLIDFGVGTLMGAPAITSARHPPGTLEFRAPEAWRFSRENDSASYDYSMADELWALGVTFYWLLTDVLPFGDRGDEDDGGLAERVLHQTPIAPHLLNPRVPRALSDICMRMLEKEPAARYPSVVEFCAALDAALAGAELDGSWDLPLIDPDEPHDRTTEEDPARVDANDSKRWLHRWRKEKRRRGRKLLEKAGDAPEPATAPPASQATASVEAPSETSVPPPPASRRRGRLVASAGLVAGVVLGLFLFAHSPLFTSVSEPPYTSSNTATTRQTGPGHEVASTAKPPDPPDGEGAAPTMDSISAPVMITMLGKDDLGEKPQQKKTKSLGSAGKVLGTAAICTTLAACPAPQVRPTPEPAACPAGAVEAMAEKLGVRVGQKFSAYLGKAGPPDIIIRDGPISAQLGPRRPGESSGVIILSGTLTIGKERVFGRFTEARDLKADGQPFPVCFELWDGWGRGRGVVHEPSGGSDSVRIDNAPDVMAVRGFE
ncbi:protein kinase [Archangium violaceum]|uniref:serine/threonine-protein kinase n=1 Tax=Archangium violaceum TaxID=83451 RepID=UPI0019514CDD|nr:serine/threonine-protein kinase [Archangium violaceum]QRO02209.1 protein kinase [Archangium violaceum]